MSYAGALFANQTCKLFLREEPITWAKQEERAGYIGMQG